MNKNVINNKSNIKKKENLENITIKKEEKIFEKRKKKNKMKYPLIKIKIKIKTFQMIYIKK